MITLEGYITTFEITPASTDDREGLKDIMDGKSGLVVLGDKGYVGKSLAKEINKILAYNLCLALNSIFHETCELGRIKQLIF